MPAEVAPAPLQLETTEPNEIEPTQPTPIHFPNRQSKQTVVISPRRPQSLLTYFLVCLMQVITVFLSILLIVVPADQLQWVYLTYIIMTCVRVLVFAVSSLQLIGLSKDLVKLYLLIDNVLLVMIASVITYIFLNYPKQIPNIIGAIVCYPILLFFLVGNGRVMLVYCEWKSWQVVVYKSIKLIGSTYFLIYGCYILIKKILPDDQKEVFLLWVFTTCAFWAEMCFQINTKDESDNLNTSYILLDNDQ